jgi:hypothetical protein
MNKTTTEQNKDGQSCLVQLDYKGNIQWISLNPNPIQLYATELWETLSEKETAITYKQALVKTWNLLKYLLALLLSIFLLTVALIVSIWGIGFNLGEQFQQWLDNGGQGRTPEEFVTKLLKIIVFPIQKIVEWANKYVEKYLPEWNPSNCKFFESTEEKKS